MIDVDVEQRNRQRVIEHLKEQYTHVYQVRTFTSMADKAAQIRAKMILGKDAKQDDIDKLANNLVGIIANTSVHASAVLVFPTDPTEFCAIEKQGDTLVAAYDYHELEEIGLAKVDVLGLKNLDIIQDTLDLIKDTVGVDINLDTIPLDDKNTSDLLCSGKTDGVFQIESSMMKGIVNGIQPHCFEDLTPIVALGRPAVLSLGLDKEYIRLRKEYLDGKST